MHVNALCTSPFYSCWWSLSHRSWQAAWPAWWKWLLSWWCQFVARGLSSLPSPVPEGTPRLEWDKSSTEEAVLGLALLCCWLVPCAPPAGLFEHRQLVEQSLAWLGRKETSVRKTWHWMETECRRLGVNFLCDTKRDSQNLTTFDEVSALISSAMICPFGALSLKTVSNIIKQQTAQK